MLYSLQVNPSRVAVGREVVQLCDIGRGVRVVAGLVVLTTEVNNGELASELLGPASVGKKKKQIRTGQKAYLYGILVYWKHREGTREVVSPHHFPPSGPFKCHHHD
jgi:hypothetical protein